MDVYSNKELYDKYDLLLPSKFEGGYLIIALFEKLKAQELSEQFSFTDIRNTLTEISNEYQQETVPQTERILKVLLHFFLRNQADEPGKYYLTDYAKNVVELIKNKLENPYKAFPLKKSFERFFIIRSNQIKSILDLEEKFGRLFIEGPKKIINDHLESLEDELQEAYGDLNRILQSDEQSATTMVREFAIVFKTFGDKAEDITNAIASKDKFIFDLQGIVDLFYQRCYESKKPETNVEKESAEELKHAWEKSREIYSDIESFFKSVDSKISNIRRQINIASDKLSELHEQFSSRSHLRLQIKRLLNFALDSASYDDDGAIFTNLFPLKTLVNEETRIFYPEHYDFNIPTVNYVIQIERDEAYESQQKYGIEKEIMKQQIINEWLLKAKTMLLKNKDIVLDNLLQTIIDKEKDFSIAYQVAIELVSFVSEHVGYEVNIEQQLITLKENELSLWKTNLKNLQGILS